MLDLVVKTLAAAGLLVLVCVGLAERGEGQQILITTGQVDFTAAVIASTMPTELTTLLVLDMGTQPQPVLVPLFDAQTLHGLNPAEREWVRKYLGQ